MATFVPGVTLASSEAWFVVNEDAEGSLLTNSPRAAAGSYTVAEMVGVADDNLAAQAGLSNTYVFSSVVTQGITVAGNGFFSFSENAADFVDSTDTVIADGDYTCVEFAQIMEDHLNADPGVAFPLSVAYSTAVLKFVLISTATSFIFKTLGGLNVATGLAGTEADLGWNTEASTFVLGESVVGATSGAVGVITDLNGVGAVITLVDSTGTFQMGETIMGEGGTTPRALADGAQDFQATVGIVVTGTVNTFALLATGGDLVFAAVGANPLGDVMGFSGQTALDGVLLLAASAINGVVNAAATTPSLNEHAYIAAQYLPTGLAFASKLNMASNLYMLFRGFARSFSTMSHELQTLQQELPPDETTLFLSEWEQAVGLPDTCIPRFGDSDERRTMILAKLAYMNIQTDVDFVLLAWKAFGIVVTVASGRISFDAGNPHAFADATEAMFTVVVTFPATLPQQFPYTYPIPFGSEGIVILRCLYTMLKPANCNVLFVEA